MFPLKLKSTYLERMTDDEFFQFCQENRETRFEREPNGQIVIMSPTGLFTSDRNSEINTQLRIWNKKNKLGHILDSNSGFFLPNEALRSPDAAWVSNEKWSKYTPEELSKFAYMVPEFIIELKSPSDHISQLKKKMIEWMENGVLLGWLIDPDKEVVYVYNQSNDFKEVEGFDQNLTGEPILKGFEMVLSELRIS